jgi:hypothetical protein
MGHVDVFKPSARAIDAETRSAATTTASPNAQTHPAASAIARRADGPALQMQKMPMAAFLPRQTPSNVLQKVCRQHLSFPIVSHNGFVEMKFLEYNLAKPAFDVRSV